MCTLSSPGPSIHPKIQLRKLSNGQLHSDFRIENHTPENVVMAIEAYALPLEDHTSDQRQALRDYKLLRANPSQNMKDRKLLLEYLHIFDRIFFFRALTNNFQLKVVEVISETERGCVGLTEFHPKRRSTDPNQESKLVTITIGDHTKLEGAASGEALVDEYLGTLLHEALHAMFDLYTCTQHHLCDELYSSELGSGGHGIRWVEAAKKIEAATKTLGLARRRADARLRLGISRSVQIDSKESK